MEPTENYPTGEVLKLFFRMLAIVAGCEIVVMAILYQLPWLGLWSMVADPLLLLLIAAPVLYYLVTPTLGSSVLLLRRTGPAVSRSDGALHLFRELIEQSGDIVAIVEPDTARLLHVNESLSRMLGFSRAEMLTLGVRDFDVQMHSEVAWSSFVEELKSKEMLILQSELRRKDGTTVPVEVNAKYTIQQGNDYIVVVSRDMTERKRIEKALRDSEKRSRAWLEHSPACTKILDLEFNLQYMSTAGGKGLKIDDVTQYYGKPFPFDFYPESFRTRMTRDLETVKETGEIIAQEAPAVDLEGNEVWFHSTIVPVRDDNNRIDYIIIVSIDTTERKQLESRHLASEERYRTLTDNIQDSIMRYDQQCRHLYQNRTGYAVTGFTEEEFIGRTHRELGFDDVLCDLWEEKIAEVFDSGNAANVNFEWQAMEGPAVLDVHLYPEKARDGMVKSVLAISHDITDRTRRDQEQSKMQKLESVGVLAGGIAHDLNNLLTGVVGNLSLARMYEDPADKDTRIEEAEKASLRIEALTKQLLTFSKGGSPIREEVDMGTFMRDSVNFALRGSNVTGQFAIADNLWHPSIDEGQINQVISNLIINATQSMPQGGTVRLSAENVHLESGAVRALAAGPHIKISFRDEGQGMSREVQRQIFDPFFTTKETGSGLGLATSHSIIKAHDGHISVESTVGVGSTFVIYLPMEGDSASALPENPDSAPIMGQGRILVMDDDEMIRSFVATALGKLGYEITTSKDGLETVEIYREAMESFHPYDSVILDLTIPGGSGGSEVIQRLKEMDPNVRAIVASGYSTDPVMANFEDYGFQGGIGKPFNVSELSKVLNDVLNES